MKKYWKPIITLMALSPLLTEVLSENAPAIVFFTPFIFFFFITIGYGFPVLIIRELYIRKNLSILGLFFLGLIYGIYNEGLIAKTLFYPFHSPVDSFAVYGLLGNLRLPWSMLIVTWHSIYAVIVPIVIVGYLFPHVAKESWLGKKTIWVLGIFSLSMGTFAFFSTSPVNPPGLFGNLILILICWALIFFLLKKAPKIPQITIHEHAWFSWKKAVLTGLGLNVILNLIPFIIAGLQIPALFFMVYFSGALWYVLKKVTAVQELSLLKVTFVGLGGMIGTALLAIPVGVASGRGNQILTSIMFLVIFMVVSFKIKKQIPSALSK